MDQLLPRVWAFDRFTLDLARGSLRSGAEEIELRPKSFDVLCYLVENAGRLISKQELHDAVWGNVAVSDDSLVQCVREVRQKLGDDAHQLIKTVSRRGYLLDAAVTRVSTLMPTVLGTAGETMVTAAPPIQASRNHRRGGWALGVLFMVGALAVAFIIAPAKWIPTEITQLFSPPPVRLPEEVTQRMAALALAKGFELPTFQITEPGKGVPENARRFIGVWVSDEGWNVSGRQLMMIVTHADHSAVASGYLVNGPAKPRSHTAGPAFSTRFSGQIMDRTLRYDGRMGMAHATLTTEGRIDFRMAFEDGGSSSVVLYPVWKLSDVRGEVSSNAEP